MMRGGDDNLTASTVRRWSTWSVADLLMVTAQYAAEKTHAVDMPAAARQRCLSTYSVQSQGRQVYSTPRAHARAGGSNVRDSAEGQRHARVIARRTRYHTRTWCSDRFLRQEKGTKFAINVRPRTLTAWQ